MGVLDFFELNKPAHKYQVRVEDHLPPVQDRVEAHVQRAEGAPSAAPLALAAPPPAAAAAAPATLHGTMSRFHSYSFGNIMLIHAQRPDATMVAGYQC